MKLQRGNCILVHFLFTLVTIEMITGLTLPALPVSTTPPVVFDRTPLYWSKQDLGGNSRSVNNNDMSPSHVGVILRLCPASLPVYVNTCDVEKYTCLGRCGEVLHDANGPPTARVSCSCDILCSVYGDCCTDFGDNCPSILAEFEAKLGHFRGVTAACTNDGYKMVNSCPNEPPMETEEPGNGGTTPLSSTSGGEPGFIGGLRTGLSGGNGSLKSGNSTVNATDIGSNNTTTNSSAVATTKSPEATTISVDDTNTNNNNATEDTESGRGSRFTDGLVVTDPDTGIVYANQSIMACNRNMTLRLRQEDAQSDPLGPPILWSRRMFVQSSPAQPEKAVVIEFQEVISWIDYPPPGVTPRYCAKRFQLSCFRQIEESDCWFMIPDSMSDFCYNVRNAYQDILDEGGRISSDLLDQYPLDSPGGPVSAFVMTPNTDNSSSISNITTYLPVDFPKNETNGSCTLRNFKTSGRSVKGMSFSLTMALNHETGVFVLSNENPFDVNWEKIQCRMEGSSNGLEPICDTVYCSTGYFFAPNLAATSSCLKPDLLEISFIFRGIDSATLAKILDLIQAVSVYYGPGMNVQALGGFVDMDQGNMAYTDMYRINNISITDVSDRIPSTLALVESLREIDFGERSKFPASIQLCFVFREISTEPPEGDLVVGDDDNENLLFTQKETVQSRCDVVYLHDRSVYSISLHKTAAQQTGPREQTRGSGLEQNGANAHDKVTMGKMLMMAAAVLFGVLKVM